MDATGDAQRATRREWLGLAVLALPTLLLSLDVSVLYLALPHLSADLGADSTQQLWILDIYSFMLAGFLVTMGTLGDRIGRRRLLLAGAGAFGGASVLAAFSTSPEMLIAARARLGSDVLNAARAAFTAGLNVVRLVGAIVFVGLAVTSVIVLRRAGRSAAIEAPTVDTGAMEASQP